MTDRGAKHKEMLARFARIAMRSEEAKRQSQAKKLTEIQEEYKDSSWNPKTRNKILATDLAYAAPYQADYTGLSTSASSTAVSDSGDNENNPSNDVIDNSDARSCAAASTVSGSGMRRGRHWTLRMALSSRSGESVMDFEQTSTILAPTECDEKLDEYESTLTSAQIRKTYFRNYRMKKDLPIFKQRQYIINSINSYSVCIIDGATGCGKTTQVPVYILEDAILSNKQTKAPVIWVTQPRRIAAKTIARRVCEDHEWQLGTIVGYQVGLDNQAGPETCINYCTSGVLLQKLLNEKSLKNFSHIIIDEVHERDADTDLLLMMVRKLMRKEQSFFRLIVMSATMEVHKLKNYFSIRTSFGHRSIITPAKVKIALDPSFTTRNDVQTIYMDAFESVFRVSTKIPAFDINEAMLYNDCVEAAAAIILYVIPRTDTYSKNSDSTLVFLPGIAEILRLYELLIPHANEFKLQIIPMHSSLPHEDLDKVFIRNEFGQRKVVLATNIAESSITVEQVGYVIDFCLTKVLMKDQISGFPTLKLNWCSNDKCVQRAGRTGRCCPGKVFRMVTRDFYKQLPEFTEPELLVAPLELSVLRVKKFTDDGEKIEALLAVVLDPPRQSDIQQAVLELKQLGALSSTFEGKICKEDGDMTELGRIIASLPIDVHLSKLIVIAAVLDVLEDAIIIAACLSTNRTIVKHEFNDRVETYKKKLEWSQGSNSDLLLTHVVYKQFEELRVEQAKGAKYMRNWCRSHKLDDRKLDEVHALIQELKNRLKYHNIQVQEQPNRVRDRDQDELMLKVAFCASFYPNYFLTHSNNDEEVRDIESTYSGLDPAKTVILSGFPVNQVPLYKSQVMDILSENGILPQNEDDVDFIADSSRALLVFNNDNPLVHDDSSLRALGDNNIVEQTSPLNASLLQAIKFGEKREVYIREYNETVALDRLEYYKEQRNSIDFTGRLKPWRMKVVSGREADNSHLDQVSEDQYNTVLTNQNYIEVKFNQVQDDLDRAELEKLEARYSELVAKNPISVEDIIKEKTHPLFKAGEVRYGYRKPIRGPESSIQMQFEPVLYKCRQAATAIDPLSVNSVLLNPDFTRPRRQMLVAANVVQKKSDLQARDTTLMPNIRGLPTIMSLLFAQYYRLVYNTDLNCVAGAVFGLGWDDEDRPLDRNYEVELGFDVQITKDDIYLINMGRSAISDVIRYIDTQDSGLPRAKKQQEIRELIMTLIRKKRFPIEEDNLRCIDYESGEYIKDKHNVPKEQLTPLEKGQVRNFLPLMENSREFSDMDYFVAIEKNLEKLDEIDECKLPPPIRGIRCYLCGRNNYFTRHSEIVRHLDGENHRLRRLEFEQKIQRLRESNDHEQHIQQT